MQRSSQIHHPSLASASSLDIDQLERVQRSSQIESPSRHCGQSSDPFPVSIVPICSVEDYFERNSGRTVLSDKLSSESSSGRTFGRTVLSDKLSLQSSLAETSGETVLSDQLPLLGWFLRAFEAILWSKQLHCMQTKQKTDII